MEKFKVLNLYIASLRALYLIHQNSHWSTKGTGFYGDHLLFEKIYHSAGDNADLAAEKFIGTFGLESLNYDLQIELIGKIMLKYSDLKDEPIELSLKAEEDFLSFAEEVYTFFDKENLLSLGIDDMMTEISGQRDTACYLLKQSLGS